MSCAGHMVKRLCRPGRWRGRDSTRGFTLFEFAATSAVSSILVVILMHRLWIYQEEAERIAMRAVLANLGTAVRTQTLALYLKGREGEVAALAGQNPMDWLAAKPANYRGEFSAPSLENIEGNSWFFDKSNKKLAYLLRERNFFYQKGLKPTYFHVELIRLPTSPARPSGTPKTIDGVVLNQVKE